jgi:hypothetical protein
MIDRIIYCHDREKIAREGKSLLEKSITQRREDAEDTGKKRSS